MEGRMNFKVGQAITIKRQVGHKDGEDNTQYYHGGTLAQVPEGTKGKIRKIVDDECIHIDFGDRKYGGVGGWHVHPKELFTAMEYAEIERKKKKKAEYLERLLMGKDPLSETEEKWNQLLDEEAPEAPETNGKFKPSFNPLREFGVWARQEFPMVFEKKGSSDEEANFETLKERIDEVGEAAKSALDSFGRKNRLKCQKDYFNNGYNALSKSITSTKRNKYSQASLGKLAKSLKDFVKRIDNQEKGKKEFPYKDQYKRGEYDYGYGRRN